MKLTVKSIALLAAVLLAGSTSCVAPSRVERNRAIAEHQRAEAELDRAEAEAIRNGDKDAYVEATQAPIPPQMPADAQPPCPSSEHVWISGCHVWHGGAWTWVPGRWALPPRAGAHWVAGHWRAHRRGFVWVEARWD